ncbi:glycosyltransferase [Paeniglutamicibacter sulfureus]|uniref:D-inositol 3-phosphate glycosyltransferase n=1 Tax=Paeniglutamicibacter sulfureus TaxID=43666 RepID=A0ABU2BP05_9MICC|nr:glycosyltransferase [Paeniglutamicibacter sulfureus]MDR7360376.1 glycosyltransferase involved in cell wall biosynthesis [Paeniglutamicibacter sulfureus]
MRQSTKMGTGAIVSRAQSFKLRESYSKHEGHIEDLLLDDVLALKVENDKLKAANGVFKKQAVKDKGLLARQMTSLKKLEREKAENRKSLNVLGEELRIARIKLQNEKARSEKFKKAYDNLRAHPVVRAVRSLKSPFSKPLTAPASGTNTLEIDGPLSAGIQVNQTRSSPTPHEARPVNYPSMQPQERNLEKSTEELAATVVAVKNELLKFRDLGEIRGPLNTIRELVSGIDGLPNFGSMADQLAGWGRLQERLPDVPPKVGTAAYVPLADKVMYCAHSTGEYNSNGYSTRTTGLTSAVTEAGLELFIVARPGYPWDSNINGKMPPSKRLVRRFQGVDTHFNPGVSLRNDPLDKFIQLSVDMFMREAMLNRPSVIVSASNHITALPALIAARRLGIPFIYEVRGLWEVTAAASNETWAKSERFTLAVELERLVANNADRVFAITEEVKKELVLRGTAADRIDILPNAANIFQYVPLPSERSAVKNLKKKGEFLLGYAGSLVGYEGLDLLVDAISKLPSELAHVGVLVVGDGAELASLKSKAERLGVSDRVRFTGRVPNEDINDYLALFDAVVCPRKSNIVTELVSPLKPIEAMAAGRPVIGSNVGPIATLLGSDGSRGVIFDADDVDSLIEKIRLLANDPKLSQSIGRRARKWTVEERTWPIIAKTFVSSVRVVQRRTRVGKDLRAVNIALIADTFTASTLSREVHVVSPTPSDWRELLSESNVDALFVESAWAGNNGAWTRKVGYYDDEECSHLSELIDFCRTRGIPTIFWNKEDPVHFNRFKSTAELFDVVLSTDANCLEGYWENRGPHLKALGSMSFWAQPDIHNPKGTSRPYSHSVAYGGSYYGERYAERSSELKFILQGAKTQGLTIYDRQADMAESVYKFPSSLQEFVRGGLAYEEMVEAYKSHPVHVNVNSVNNSPTMFSRRVFELAACGTATISGKSFGVSWLFNDMIPVVRTKTEAQLISELWMNSEKDRVQDAWGPLRITFEKHLACHRLASALRMAGIQVEIPELPSFQLELASLTVSNANSILASSVRPALVIVRMADCQPHAGDLLRDAGIEVTDVANLRMDMLRINNADSYLDDSNLFQDLLTAYFYSDAARVVASDASVDERGLPLWWKPDYLVDGPTLSSELVTSVREGSLTLRRPFTLRRDLVEPAVTESDRGGIAERVLIAGHDLKFAGAVMDAIEGQGHKLLVDKWKGHAQHDVERSRALLEEATTIFCEWSLGNLAWYSKNKRPEQRLITRFHSQELFTDYPRAVDFKSVDRVIFVSELIRGMAIKKFGIPSEKTMVIPNAVDTRKLDLPKNEDSNFVLGFVGMVPQMKRFDLVLDLLEHLRQVDDRYTLRIKGKRPEQYPWMAAREDEMAFYNAQYERIETSPLLKNSVIFDPEGNDMAEWYRGIGIAISTSDFESFHFTLADGAASRALPVGLAWPGAEWIYPESWIFTDTKEMSDYIVATREESVHFEEQTAAARQFVVQNFNSEDVLANLLHSMNGI